VESSRLKSRYLWLYYLVFGVEHDDRHCLYQTTPVLTLSLLALPVSCRPMLVYGFPQIAYRLWCLTMMTRRPCCLPSYRPQPTACLVDLLSVLRRRVSTYPPTFPPDGPPVNPTYVAPYPLTIEQIHQPIQCAGVFDTAVLLLCLHHTPFSLLPHLYRLGRFSFPCLIFLLLCSFFSLALLLFSLFCYMLCLLLGRLAVSARGDVL
jgi:hypothetical protein